MSCTRRLTVIPPECLTADTRKVDKVGSLSRALSSLGPGFLLSTSLNLFAWRLDVVTSEQIVSKDDRQFNRVGPYPFLNVIERGNKPEESCREDHSSKWFELTW